MNKMEANKAIAIIGVGAVFPGSETLSQYYENILRNRCFVREIPEWLWEQDIFYNENRDRHLKSYCKLAGLLGDIDMDVSHFRIPPRVANYMSRNQKLALMCTEEALRDSGYLTKSFNRDKTGVILGAVVGDSAEQIAETILGRRFHHRLKKLVNNTDQEQLLDELWELYTEQYEIPLTEDSLAGSGANLVAGRIASTFDLHGPNYAIDSACASSPAAISSAIEMLRNKTCDMMITGGVDTDSNPGFFVGFSEIGALSADGSFPFDQRADGFVMGEGCGILVLKRYQDAIRDGDNIHALIRGWGSSSDGAGKSITAPSSQGQLRALERAYQDAALSPADLDFVECHGTGTQVGDATELEALGTFIQGKRKKKLTIGSVKGMTGHLKSASGVAGLLRGLLTINTGLIPPQVNFEQPNSSLDWKQLNLHIPVMPETIESDEVITGISSFGFGGTNFHLVLSSSPQQMRKPLMQADYWLYPLPDIGEKDIAFLFPGQGSQYVDMLKELRDLPIAQKYLNMADSITLEITGKKISEIIYPENRGNDIDEELELQLKKTNMAQPAIFVTSAILLELIQQQGIKCSMSIGHSQGELTALYAAGYLNFEDAMKIVTHRGQLFVEQGSNKKGSMAFINTHQSIVQEMLNEIEGYIVVANLNSYSQTVVSGDINSINQFIDTAISQGYHARQLSVDMAFHSAYMQDVVDPFRKIMFEAKMCYGNCPVSSHKRSIFYPLAEDKALQGSIMTNADRARLIDLFAPQPINPIDFISQVELAYQAGIRRFIEIGPKKTLTGLVNDILQGKEFQTLFLDQRSGVVSHLENVSPLLKQSLTFYRSPLATQSRTIEKIKISDIDDIPESANPLDWVRQVVAIVSGYSVSDINDTDEFEGDLGIDTLKIFDIISRLRGNVLPQKFRNYRQATSIKKIITLASQGAKHEISTLQKNIQDDELSQQGQQQSQQQPQQQPQQQGSASKQLYCYRQVKQVQVNHLTEKVSSLRTGINIITPDKEVFDDAHNETILLWSLPFDERTLINKTIPELLKIILKLSEKLHKQTQMPHSVHFVSFAAQELFNQAIFQALSGLIKSMQFDFPQLLFSSCHLDSAQPNDDELHSALLCQSIGTRIRADYSIELYNLLPEATFFSDKSVSISSVLDGNDIVLVTGGARGITSKIVQQLLHLTSAKFILLGRKKQVEPWINQQERVEYIQCDISDNNAVANIANSLEKVSLLIHAAGVVYSRSPKNVTNEEISTVMGTKILGLHYLLKNLKMLRGIINFSSTAAFFGAPGNMDYAAANGYLLDPLYRGHFPRNKFRPFPHEQCSRNCNKNL